MAGSIPKTWMPKADMQRIHLHWTAGGHKANKTDKKSYHVLVEGDGKLVRGNKPISGNARGAARGQRTSHTLNANTGAIGISLCCMAGSQERPWKPGRAPMTEAQWNAGIKAIAQLAHAYDILVTPKTILTHAEVWPNLNIRQRNKWDITRLAFDDSIQGHRDIGDHMRSLVAAELDGVANKDVEDRIVEEVKLPKFRVTGVAPSKLNFRDGPNGRKIGALPERSRVERLAAVGDWWQVRTTGGYVGWVFSDFLTPMG